MWKRTSYLSLKKTNESRAGEGGVVRRWGSERRWGVGIMGGGGKGCIKKALASCQVGGGLSLQGFSSLGVGLRVPILLPVTNT